MLDLVTTFLDFAGLVLLIVAAVLILGVAAGLALTGGVGALLLSWRLSR